MDNQDHQTLEEGLEHHGKDQNKQINPEGHIVQETGENFKTSKTEKHNSSLIHCLRESHKDYMVRNQEWCYEKDFKNKSFSS